MNDINDTRKRIKAIIESSGYSLRGFAREVGITPGGLSGIINGKSKIISGMFLKILEFRFNVNPLWLETGEGPVYQKDFHLENSAEIDMILKFRKLAKEQQQSINVMIDALYQQVRQNEEQETRVAETARKKSRLWP